MMMKRDLYGLFIPEITVAIAEYGIESYRARQIAEWMYQRGVADFSAMTNLPLQHRQQLAAHFNC
ncbi:MAG TPA: 23S rRNA (adenine(2503)-C(2))-methyltransferase RlmN, partial [Sporomusaceae bacterium]|nr:23S rRNA (adenine(2503)-C(2))-methyltransferase RlmN [Sporomusaceae bacterium]